MFDIISSTIVGSLLMLSIFAVGSNLSEVSYRNTFDYSVQLAATDFSQTIEYDFNKIGFRAPKPSITAAESTSITFLSDITNTSTLATIRYYAGSKTELPGTQNPDDLPLYKKVNNGADLPLNYGLTYVKFQYYDSLGVKLSVPVTGANLSKIKSIKVEAVIQSTMPVDSTYSKLYWERTFFPKNL